MSSASPSSPNCARVCFTIPRTNGSYCRMNSLSCGSLSTAQSHVLNLAHDIRVRELCDRGLIFVFFAGSGVYTRAMSSSGRTARPPLAKAKAGAGEPFSALLAAAAENASAAQGLALAYAALERPQREQLIDAVLTD